MLPLYIPQQEYFNEKTNEFINVPECTLYLEHSLASISDWESKWCKPFLSKDEKTSSETKSYIKSMVLNPPENIDLILSYISPAAEEKIAEYIDSPQSATWFKEDKNKSPNRKVITSEIIYFWMVAQNIPFECQYWHLNRLLTLIRICNEENSPKKKMSKRDIMKNNAALNAARKAKYNTRG